MKMDGLRFYSSIDVKFSLFFVNFHFFHTSRSAVLTAVLRPRSVEANR